MLRGSSESERERERTGGVGVVGESPAWEAISNNIVPCGKSVAPDVPSNHTN